MQYPNGYVGAEPSSKETLVDDDALPAPLSLQEISWGAKFIALLAEGDPDCYMNGPSDYSETMIIDGRFDVRKVKAIFESHGLLLEK